MKMKPKSNPRTVLILAKVCFAFFPLLFWVSAGFSLEKKGFTFLQPARVRKLGGNEGRTKTQINSEHESAALPSLGASRGQK